MSKPRVSDDEFIDTYRRLQSLKAVSDALGMQHQNVHARRKRIEKRYGVVLPQFDTRPAYNRSSYENHDPALIHLKIDTGNVIVFSDAHYHPAYEPWTCHRALVRFCKELKPKIVISNGDIFDFPSISRHHRIGWENRPTVQQELEYVQDRLEEVEKASIGAKFYRTWGNHDLRFDGILANKMAELEGVKGTCLKDHIPRWNPCWALQINKYEAYISHRWKTSVHSPHNNTKDAGVSYGTGHDHFPRVDPWSDLRGLRFGFNSGTLADISEEDGSDISPFRYREQAPNHWWSSFITLSFVDGKMLEPQLVRKWNKDTVQYCGRLITV
ncbi:MAG: metallophosphoesterase family protein [Thermodesulfobacteriota bacterium]